MNRFVTTDSSSFLGPRSVELGRRKIMRRFNSIPTHDRLNKRSLRDTKNDYTPINSCGKNIISFEGDPLVMGGREDIRLEWIAVDPTCTRRSHAYDLLPFQLDWQLSIPAYYLYSIIASLPPIVYFPDHDDPREERQTITRVWGKLKKAP